MNEKLDNLCKIIQRLTLLIGITSVALPIIFWSKIPDTIPTHYGISGAADSYGGRESIILLLIVSVVIMGFMKAALLGLKINAEHPNNTYGEDSVQNLFYPVLSFVNLALQSMLAYIIYCTATASNLGVFMVPVFLAAVILPTIVLFSIRKKIKAPEQDFDEKPGEGITYKSKVDWWLGAILIFALASVLNAALIPILNGEGLDPGTFIPLLILLVIFVPLLNIKYVLYSDHLYVSCGYLGKSRIKYENIRKVSETRNPLSSAALSLDRLQIDYVVNGTHSFILISPKPKKEFMVHLEELCNKAKAR